MSSTAVGEDRITTDMVRRALTLQEARGKIKGRNGPASVLILRKWANPKKGWKGRDGTVVILRTIRFNGSLLTMPEWCEQFELARIEAGSREREKQPKVIRTAKQREAANKRAAARLRAKGVGKKDKPEPAAQGAA